MKPDETTIGDRFQKSILDFAHTESAAGLMLLMATIAAMLVKNSALGDLYAAFLQLEGQVRLGSIDVNKPLFLWVNDLWMAIFFFVIGLELKQERLHGHLRHLDQIMLPAIGAVGGVAVPALVFLWVTAGDESLSRGWAIPTATDIAFSLAVLTAVASRVPVSLKIFLMTLAILDDLIAIIVIALFYTANLSVESLLAGGVMIGLMVVLRLVRVTSVAPYLICGVLLWVCVLKSGVHATLAGVITAFFIPAGEGRDNTIAAIIEDLHPWVALMILPAFAFVNAGIDFADLNLDKLYTPLPLGIFLGLVVGKSLGVFGVSWIAVVTGFAQRPAGASWGQLFGVSVLCGIGFTMSLFIGGLAFAEEGVGYARVDRLAILLASFVCAVSGYIILRFLARSEPGAEHAIEGGSDHA
jgi:NhaA family Na+:H+ antiporter